MWDNRTAVWDNEGYSAHGVLGLASADPWIVYEYVGRRMQHCNGTRLSEYLADNLPKCHLDGRTVSVSESSADTRSGYNGSFYSGHTAST